MLVLAERVLCLNTTETNKIQITPLVKVTVRHFELVTGLVAPWCWSLETVPMAWRLDMTVTSWRQTKSRSHLMTFGVQLRSLYPLDRF